MRTYAEQELEAGNCSEAETVRLAQAGDAAAFEQLYRRHSKRVYAICLRIVKNDSEAEDLTQEAFLLLFRKIHTFRAESKFSTWLHRLTVNLALMRLRKKRRHLEVSLDGALGSDQEEASPLSEYGEIDRRLNGTVDRVNLIRAIERLSHSYRRILMLHDVGGHQHHEIASILGCSSGNSKSQLHKARLRVRKLLQEDRRNRRREEWILSRRRHVSEHRDGRLECAKG